MLTTRLWMGAVLIGMTIGMLVGDQHTQGWFPFLFVFQMSLMLAACYEFIHVLGPNRAPQRTVCYLGVVTFVFANWLINCPAFQAHSWMMLVGIQAGFLLLAFLYEVVGFFGPGRSVERIALTWLIVGYLGLLPCFFAQIRWLPDSHQANSVRL